MANINAPPAGPIDGVCRIRPASRKRAADKLTIGVTDWNLKLGASPDALPLAKRIGFEAVQISFGRRLVNGKMPVDDPAIIARYLSLSEEHKIPIDGTCVYKLHDNGLKNDKPAFQWVRDSIRLMPSLVESAAYWNRMPPALKAPFDIRYDHQRRFV